EQECRPALGEFAGVVAEMLGEPGPPGRRHAIAGFVEPARPAAGAAAHQPDMAAMAAGQQRDDGGAFAVPARRQHDALVGPVDHAQGYSTAAGIPASAENERWTPCPAENGFTTKPRRTRRGWDTSCPSWLRGGVPQCQKPELSNGPHAKRGSG